MQKYALLRQRIEQASFYPPITLCVPAAAGDEDLLRVHDADYLYRVTRGELDRQEQSRIGFPWSRRMVERSRRSVGGTIGAVRSAFEHGVSVNLAGGTHHAHIDHGGGYCVFNDAVVAARWAQTHLAAERIAFLDLDVHQGDGTARLCQSDSSLYTCSIHGAGNYPARKASSDRDIALPDGTDDASYLAALQQALDGLFADCRPDLMIYLAGADPYHGDRLGRLALSKAGLRQRDIRVFDACRQHRVPVAMVMAGGYAERVQDIVDIHFNSVVEAHRSYQCWQRRDS